MSDIQSRANSVKRSKNQSVIMKDKVAKQRKCKKQMKENFKSIDYFGQSLNFTWNGEDQFKTTFGAFISLILMIILLAYSAYRLYYLAMRLNPTIQKITLIRSPEEDNPFRPQDFGFDFAFGLKKTLDPSIGFFTAKYIQQEVVGTDRKKYPTNLTQSACSTEHFMYSRQEQVVEFGIDKLQCLTSDEYDFQGNFYMQHMRYLEIKLWKCLPWTKVGTIYENVTCQNKTAIDSYFSNEVFSFAFVNSLFLVDEFEDPILHYIDDSLFFELDPHVIKKANFFIQHSTAELEDDLIQFGQSKEIDYHQINNIRTYDDDYTDQEGYLVAVYMRADKQYDIYQRQVTDFLTLLGDIGGLQGTLIALGMLLVGFITSRMFMSQIIKKVYQIRKYENFEEDNSNKFKLGLDNQQNYTQHELITDPEKYTIQNIFKGQYPLPINKSTEFNIKQREHELQQEFKTKEDFYNIDVGKILLAFLNRQRFKYTLQNIIQYILGGMCFRRVNKNRRKKEYKKHYLFEKASEKFSQELDAVRIIKTLRKFKMLAQAMLSQKHRLLLRFQRQNLIETSSSSSDSDNNAFDTVRLMENKNPLVRLVIYGKLKKMMTQFDGKKLEPLERNMMRGLFIRKIKDFAEDQANLSENKKLIDRLLEELKINRDVQGSKSGSPIKVNDIEVNHLVQDSHRPQRDEQLTSIMKDIMVSSFDNTQTEQSANFDHSNIFNEKSQESQFNSLSKLKKKKKKQIYENEE